MVDLYGANWTHRNMDFNYILCDWQYRAYMEANYFYRPLRWDAGYWHFSVYARYPCRDYYYFGRPSFYSAYRGAHSWRMNGDRRWYYGREGTIVTTMVCVTASTVATMIGVTTVTAHTTIASHKTVAHAASGTNNAAHSMVRRV